MSRGAVRLSSSRAPAALPPAYIFPSRGVGLLRNEAWRRPWTANIGAVWRANKEALRGRAPRYAVCLLLAVSLIGATQYISGERVAASAIKLQPTPYDYQPSHFRQVVLEQRSSGQMLPNPGVIELESEKRQQDLELRQQQALAEQYYQEIRRRDDDISKLNQALQSESAGLSQIATQLGLPKDQLAAPKPASPGSVGAFGPADQVALSAAHQAPPAGAKIVSSPQELAGMIKAYLTLPCPLPAGDSLCGQAVDHAREELARGHGLDVNKPDARPVLALDVAQPFGPTELAMEPLENVEGKLVHFHDGVDLAANSGEPVMAAASGTVTFAGFLPSGAQTVEITHAGGMKTLYLHESQLLVQQGQHVQKGQVIGLVGMTGMATGPHLHFTVQDPSGKPIDPMPFIQ